MENWYIRLKEIREKLGWSQGKLAKAIGSDISTISRYESGRGSKKVTDNFRLRLSTGLSEADVHYIETGEEFSGIEGPIVKYGSSYGRRLKSAREALGLTQRELAESIGVKERVISDVECDTRESLPVKAARALGERHHIRLAWLAHDDGPMLAGDDISDMVMVDYYPEVYASAGGGAYVSAVEPPVRFASSFFERAFEVSVTRGMHIINVVGDSMEPTLQSGEMIFVNPIENESFRDGGIYVLMCGDTILVKRVRQNPITKEYTLISDNPSVLDITMTKKESEELCTFIGRVVGHMDRV